MSLFFEKDIKVYLLYEEKNIIAKHEYFVNAIVGIRKMGISTLLSPFRCS